MIRTPIAVRFGELGVPVPDQELGIERYRAAVGRLLQQLAWYEFDEAVPPLLYRSGLDHAPGEPRVRRRWWPVTFPAGPS